MWIGLEKHTISGNCEVVQQISTFWSHPYCVLVRLIHNPLNLYQCFHQAAISDLEYFQICYLDRWHIELVLCEKWMIRKNKPWINLISVKPTRSGNSAVWTEMIENSHLEEWKLIVPMVMKSPLVSNYIEVILFSIILWSVCTF